MLQNCHKLKMKPLLTLKDTSVINVKAVLQMDFEKFTYWDLMWGIYNVVVFSLEQDFLFNFIQAR